METILGFLFGVGIGLVASIPLGLFMAYFIIRRKIDEYLLAGSARTKGLAAKLAKHAVSKYVHQRSIT